MDENIKIEIVRSRRRTLTLQITEDAGLLVKAPYNIPNDRIVGFINEKDSWIKKHICAAKERMEKNSNLLPITVEEMKSLADEALDWVPKRVAYYASLMGVTYHRITIRNQKTRWGSCSSKGNLNFNCLMMELPEEVRDYIIIHELCHRMEMNHSDRFWKLVETYDPAYKAHNAYIREKGEEILYRAFGR